MHNGSGLSTIFALSSGAPPSGVAIIRISGPAMRAALEGFCGPLAAPRRAHLRMLRDPDNGELIDHALVIWFAAPHSFTGEDVGEIHCHGGRAVIDALLGALGRTEGLHPAEPGEFTRRAFTNGKLDLTQIEGMADLVAAETRARQRQAVRQMTGGLRRIYEAWRQHLVELRAAIEARLDFADEEDVPGALDTGFATRIGELAREIGQHLDASRGAERLRDGLRIVVLGAPNSGKSSLVNALAQRDVAIVTPHPGTTRDLVEIHLDIAGCPVTIVDSAGLRGARGQIEREGINRALEAARHADLVICMHPAGRGAERGAGRGAGRNQLARFLAELASQPPESRGTGGIERGHGEPGHGSEEPVRREGPCIQNILSKADLLSVNGNAQRAAARRIAGLCAQLPECLRARILEPQDGIALSLRSPGGLDALHGALARFTERYFSQLTGTALATRARQRTLLGEAVAALERAEKLARALQAGTGNRADMIDSPAACGEWAASALPAGGVPGEELVAEELLHASHALGRITGKIDVEDLLDHIFSEFCIGK